MDLLNLKSPPQETELTKDLPFKYERYNDGYLIPALGAAKWDGHIYVSGATGAGKSYLIKQIVMHDEKKREVIVFSDLPNDESFKELYESGLIVSLEEAMTENPVDPYNNKIVIFDDCTRDDAITIRDHLLEKGRHQNTVVICVNHKLREWKATRGPLNEARYVIMFPSANKLSVVKFLDSMGLDHKIRDQIIKLSNEDGRYLIYHQFNPNALFTQRTILYV